MESKEFDDIPKRARNNSALDIPAGVINAYVFDRLSPAQRAKVEKILEQNPVARKQVDQVSVKRAQLRSLIPNATPNLNSRKSMSDEMFSLSEQAFPRPEPTVLQKIGKFLDKTIIEF